MNLKRITATAMSLCLFFAVGCGSELPEEAESKPVQSSETVVSVPEPPKVFYNPLTGLSGIDEDKVSVRPIAIMINNIAVAQGVQCGLDDADIIYETEVEGGITRLMAVYQDVSKVERVGTIRSCRYAYIDLAMGHHAVYIHRGVDPEYAKPHLKAVDDLDLDTNNYGVRLKNGLSSEHTLYTYGGKLWNGINKDFDLNNNSADPWVDFADESEQLSLSGGIANSVAVPFSTSYKTSFTYDPATGKYTRLFNGRTLTDYLSGKPTTVKNIFVLMTSVYNYSDNYHRCVELNGGDGYYIVNGTYTPISWSKGSASSPFRFTGADGSPLKVNAGDSWVCIASKTNSQPIIE